MLHRDGVVLRAIEREDLPLIHRFNNDLEVELAGGGDPPMPQSLAQLQNDFEKRNSAGRNLDFAIDIEGRCVGQAGLFSADLAARTICLGLGIGEKELWGQGYGRTVVAMLLEMAFRYHNFRRVWLRTDSTNVRAIKCYEACGFKEEGRLREHVFGNGVYQDAVYMGILRSEWNG